MDYLESWQYHQKSSHSDHIRFNLPRNVGRTFACLISSRCFPLIAPVHVQEVAISRQNQQSRIAWIFLLLIIASFQSDFHFYHAGVFFPLLISSLPKSYPYNSYQILNQDLESCEILGKYQITKF